MRHFIMTIATAALLTLGTVAAHAGEAGLGTYSEGYRIGQLTKFSVKGMMMKSGEGQMLLGSESTPYVTKDSEGNKTTVNPWYFSADPKWLDKMDNKIGEYVVIKYEQAQVKGISRDTDYSVVGVSDLMSKADLPGKCIAESFKEGSKSEGKRVGRIVKLSSKGVVNKTFEVMFQQGNSGNQFKSMSISSKPMYDCALEFLKSGAKVKIEYSQSFIVIPGTRDTSYDIVSISRAKNGMAD